ncbi:O-antigen ligase family protein [Ramlibacter tataouinensis]|uniref:Candidate membrane protein n=1 Tax=Ramlibacter tataouinensis (strain ATCC BAA-407 / DSM 14655 / LMG 21543 / TTB310) TaxID=365046 RepID=F5Y0F2_RAMTT|nr:O-antigen ligase family protein [Ramlibacter tataouinensis]AEG92174.1 candidate membrane protein [Ramlibacter tataouinensis TTB310]
MMKKPAAHKPSSGLLPLVFQAIIFFVAVSILASGRDLTQLYVQLESVAEPTRPTVIAWVQRGISLLLLLASAEQIANHFSLGRRTPSVILLLSFLLYWLGTVGIPAVFGTHPAISHDLIYSLAIGTAACLVGIQERDRILDGARNALFVLMLAGVLFIPINIRLVLDVGYSQGLIPGLPRFGGLTPHPVTQGMLAQIALLLLWCRPFQRRWLNRCAWALGLGVLFLAQSKTAWLAFLVCASCMLAVRQGGGFWQRMSDPRRGGGLGVLVCLGVIAVVLAAGTWILVGNASGQLDDFLGSREGAELMSMTGRDRIWEAALEEWRNNPMFGYGLTIWDNVYRASIGMPQATHAHNQFMDDLARSGSVGAGALVIYASVLLVLSLRYARATGGLSLVLWVAIALQSIAEVPLRLIGYGTELFNHLLLLVTLASAASAERRAAPAGRTMRYGVAS